MLLVAATYGLTQVFGGRGGTHPCWCDHWYHHGGGCDAGYLCLHESSSKRLKKRRPDPAPAKIYCVLIQQLHDTACYFIMISNLLTLTARVPLVDSCRLSDLQYFWCATTSTHVMVAKSLHGLCCSCIRYGALAFVTSPYAKKQMTPVVQAPVVQNASQRDGISDRSLLKTAQLQLQLVLRSCTSRPQCANG